MNLQKKKYFSKNALLLIILFQCYIDLFYYGNIDNIKEFSAPLELHLRFYNIASILKKYGHLIILSEILSS